MTRWNYLQIALLAACLTLAPAQSWAQVDAPGGVHVVIDATANPRPISPWIYGINEKLDGPYSNLPLRRMGGNRWTAYNWTNNASNAGNDYHFQNDSLLGGDDVPGGAFAGALAEMLTHHSALIITIPINGYVSADKAGNGDVRNSGPDYLQKRFRPELPTKGKPFTLTPSPDSPAVYQDEFVNWVKEQSATGKAGDADSFFFSLDNEPDLWKSTHAEVHPDAVTYAELVKKTIDYATAIKRVEPRAKIFGPVNYGWTGYVKLQDAPDAQNRDFQEFYLRQMAAAERTIGRRLLDVFDVHWYPEASAGSTRIVGNDVSPPVIAARVQAPRSLWDPTYTETSWITKWATKGPIKLLPRLQEKIARNYPGTELAVTEYNYGGGDHISGAIAEADVLGIFGRAGLFAACEWPMHGKEPFIAGGFQMYRDFDGAKGTFGDISIAAQSDDVADCSVYASLHRQQRGWMTIVAINKTDHDLPADFRFEHAPRFNQAAIYLLAGQNPQPQRKDVVAVADSSRFAYTMPSYSVSTIRFSAGPPPKPE